MTGEPFRTIEFPETEQADPRFKDLEDRPVADVLDALLGGQNTAVDAVRDALPALEQAVEAAAERLHGEPSSRLVYCGAGTSGRLALQDGVELGPTFNWPRERLLTLLAGGPDSLAVAQEGAEDDERAAREAVREHAIAACDVVIGVAASGRTPFTVAALQEARNRGALTIGLANDPAGRLLQIVDLPVLLRTGPEVLAGSTRLAAGTAQKIALNLLSTAVMVRLGKVFRGRMVDMRPTNQKLRARAAAMVSEVVGCSRQDAETALHRHGGSIREAIVALEAERI